MYQMRDYLTGTAINFAANMARACSSTARSSQQTITVAIARH
jgi:hypothetical protein